jgi:hypothetical protein
LPFSANSLKSYVKDLAELLSKGSIVEQKSFIRSFIERIVVNHPEAEIFYNLPIINKKGRTSKNEVLPLLQSGSPARTRTTDKLVNSQLLYRLSYWGTNTVSFRILKYR